MQHPEENGDALMGAKYGSAGASVAWLSLYYPGGRRGRQDANDCR
jgi:hypothetical protein